MRTVAMRHLVEINPPTPQMDWLSDTDRVTFAPLEVVWADRRLELSRTRPVGEVRSGYTRFLDGDVLVPKVTPTFQAGRSAIAGKLASGVGAGTTELHILRPKSGVDARYVRYGALSSPFLQEGVTAFQGVAGLQRVPDEFVRNFRVVERPLYEQRRISDLLDDQITQIDNIISARGRQLRLAVEAWRSFVDEAFPSEGLAFVKLGILARVQSGLALNERQQGTGPTRRI
jgi:type I restriction enzyme S subunit